MLNENLQHTFIQQDVRDHYELGNIIGQGSFSTVSECKKKDSNEVGNLSYSFGSFWVTECKQIVLYLISLSHLFWCFFKPSLEVCSKSCSQINIQATVQAPVRKWDTNTSQMFTWQYNQDCGCIWNTGFHLHCNGTVIFFICVVIRKCSRWWIVQWS